MGGGGREGEKKSKKFCYLVAFKEVLIAKLRAGFQRGKFRKEGELGTTLRNAFCSLSTKYVNNVRLFSKLLNQGNADFLCINGYIFMRLLFVQFTLAGDQGSRENVLQSL